MRILLTGADGQVGKSVQKQLAGTRVQLHSANRQTLDISDRQAVFDTIDKIKPTLIINAAAYTQVDLAETQREQCEKVNVFGCENLAQACEKHDIPLLHLSTDYVFDGQKQTPYLETDAAHPLNFYGLSKLHGEQAIQAYCSKYIIVRVSGVFSAYQVNFVKKILALAKQHKQLRIINDQFLCPTSASDIARMLQEILQKLTRDDTRWGLYHYCSDDVTNWFEFTQSIFAIAKPYIEAPLPALVAIPHTDYPTPAQRPLYSALNFSKLFNHFQIASPSWHRSLEPVIKDLYL